MPSVEIQLLDWTEATIENISVYKEVDTIIGADLVHLSWVTIVTSISCMI